MLGVLGNLFGVVTSQTRAEKVPQMSVTLKLRIMLRFRHLLVQRVRDEGGRRSSVVPASDMAVAGAPRWRSRCCSSLLLPAVQEIYHQGQGFSVSGRRPDHEPRRGEPSAAAGAEPKAAEKKLRVGTWITS